MDDLYLDTILDLYKHPQYKGWIDQRTEGQEIETRRAINASCGDHFEVSFLIQENMIINAKWRGQGCAISTAAMDQACGWMIGKRLSQLKSLSPKTILELVGLETIISAREKCVFLPRSLFF